MTTDMFRMSEPQLVSFLIHELLQVCNGRNTTGATSGSGTAYPSEAPDLSAFDFSFVIFKLFFSIFKIYKLSSCGRKKSSY
jgi:hypothetical protein